MKTYTLALEIEGAYETTCKDKETAIKNAVKKFKQIIDEEYLKKRLVVYEKRKCEICERNFNYNVAKDENLKYKHSICNKCNLKQIAGYNWGDNVDKSS